MGDNITEAFSFDVLFQAWDCLSVSPKEKKTKRSIRIYNKDERGSENTELMRNPIMLN